jgi:hypothetical protein
LSVAEPESPPSTPLPGRIVIPPPLVPEHLKLTISPTL